VKNGIRPREEIANALTHGLGAVASAIVLALLVVVAARGGDAREIVGVSLFGATLLLLYLASSLYHAARDPAKRAPQFI
jgi:hemolysin III